MFPEKNMGVLRSKVSKNTVVKIVSLPGKFPVIHSCG